MKEKYLMPAIRIADNTTEYIMLGTSDTPADPEEPVLGKEFDDVESLHNPKSVWEE